MLKSKLLNLLLLVVIASIGGLFFYLIKSNEILKAQTDLNEKKMASLIYELGQTKEDSNTIFQELKNSQTRVQAIQNLFGYAQRKKLDELVALSDPNSQSRRIRRPTDTVQPLPQNPTQITDNTQTPLVDMALARNNQIFNFLITGQHDRLADSMLIASVNEDKRRITLISIPRDTAINGRKINEYLSLYGIDVLKQKVEEISGLPISGYVIFNFNGFENLIDSIGGIDINVPKTIYDRAYPSENNTYTVYSITAGQHHLDGVEALKYARSRHSTSDFDRNERQQQIIEAIKEKILSMGLINDFGALENLIRTLVATIETNVGVTDAISYMQKYKDYPIARGNVLSTANYLYSTTNTRGQYVLLPRGGDFSDVREYIADLVSR